MADKIPLKVENGEIERFASGDTVPVAQGGTGVGTLADLRNSLGLNIGSTVQAWDADLDAIAAITGTGGLYRTGNGTWAVRNLTQSTGITITNSDGVAGNPTIALANLTDSGTGALLKITRDAQGRVSGTQAVASGDLTALLNAIYAPINNPTFTGSVTLPGAPASPLQAATKQYVDDLFATGGIAPFLAVRAKTTANINIAAPGATHDGIALTNGDRILVASQTTASQNGVYVYNGAGVSLTRALDADSSAEFQPARQVFVQQGTSFANTGWGVSSAANPVIGTDPITFTQVSGAAQYTAGNGLQLTGNQFSVTPVAGQLVVSGSGVGLATSGVAAGTYTKLTVDTYGRVTTGATATPGDIGAQPVDSTLTALAAFNSNGFLVQTAADTFVARTIAGTAGQVLVSNGNGTSGNPTVSLATGVIAAPGTYNSVTVDTHGRVTAGSIVPTATMNVDLTNGSGASLAICRAVYIISGNTFSGAVANTAGTKNVVGLVSAASIANSASGGVAIDGVLDATTGQWDSVTGQSGGLTPGAIYYLSLTVAGGLTSTAPTSGWIAPVGIALSTTKFKINVGQTIKL